MLSHLAVSHNSEYVTDEQQHLRASHQEVIGLYRGQEGCLITSVEMGFEFEVDEFEVEEDWNEWDCSASG